MTIPAGSETRVADRRAHEWHETTPGERFIVRLSADDTNRAYTMLEVAANPRNGVPRHVHLNEDERFVVLEGTLHMAIGDQTLEVKAGESVMVVRGVPHAWCNMSDAPVRMLTIFTPGGIEGLFEGVVARGRDGVADLLKEFGCQIVGPPMVDDLHLFDAERLKSGPD